jgi:acyl-CoA thioester hydrolase
VRGWMAAGPDASTNTTTVRMRVRFGETDLMGIAHHGSYVAYFEAARVEWLRWRGVTYASWAQRGLHLPVVELSIRYRAPVRFDDEIDVETTLAEVRVASLRFEYRILRVADGTACTVGSTRLACVDDRGVLRRFTAEMLVALNGTAPEHE